MSLTPEEIHKLSPYQEMSPSVQPCTHCGAHTRPKIYDKASSDPRITVQEAHWVCGRCNNRFMIGRVRK